MRFLPHRRMILAAFLLDFAVATSFVVTPFFIYERLHGGPGFSGTVGAFQMALYAVGCLVSAGFLAGSAGGQRWAVVGVGVFTALFALVPWTNTPLQFGVLASLPFLGLALAWPAMQTWVGAEPDPVARARHLTGFNAANAFGFMLSPLIGGPLYDLDFRLPFAALCALSLLVLGLILSLPPAKTHPPGEPEAETSATVSRGLLYASWAATLTANSLFAAARSVYPKRVDDFTQNGTLRIVADYWPKAFDAVGPATIFSWLAFVMSLAMVLSFMILGRTRIWHGSFAAPVTGQVIAAAACLVLAHTRSLVLMMACFALIGANYGLCFFSSLYYSLADARQRHRRAALNEGLLGAGGFIGGIGVGYLAEMFGLTRAYQWIPLWVGLAIAGQWLLLRAYGRKGPDASSN